MGVDVTQFKQGMREAQDSVKTLDAALKYNEKQMKASGNAEKDFSTQANLLNAKLKEQKNIVKNAQNALKEMEKNGVKTTSAAYQDMQRKLINAQSAILDTEAAINSLGTAEQTAAQSADQLSNSVAAIGSKMSLQQVQQGLKSIDGFLTSMAQTALNIGKNLVNGITESGAWADNLLTMSITTGIDVETLQKMQIAGEIFDTSVDTIVTARRKLSRGMQSGTASTIKALEDLGLALEIFDKNGDSAGVQLFSEDSQEMFWEAGRRLMGLDNADERDRLAQDIFGKSFDDLLPLFTAGEDAYNEFIEQQNAMSEEKVKTLGELNDQWEQMQYQFELTKNELMVSLAPALQTVSGVITDLLKTFNEYLETPEGKAKMQELSDAVTSLFGGLKDIKPGDVIDKAKSILEGVVNSLTWISEHWESVVHGIEAIGIAWGAIKVTQGVTTMLSLVNGLNGMAAGSAAATAGSAAGAGWGASFAAAAMAALKAVPWVAGILALMYPVSEEMGGPEGIVEGVKEAAEELTDMERNKRILGKALNTDMKGEYLIDGIYHLFGVDTQSEEEKQAQTQAYIETMKHRPASKQEQDRINKKIQLAIMNNQEYSKVQANWLRYPEKYEEAYNKMRESIVQGMVDAGKLTRDEEGGLHVPGFTPRVYVPKTGIDMKDWNEFQENKKTLEENGIEIPADLELQDAMTWAADAVEQIGVVKIPAELTIVGPTNIMHGGGGSARDIGVYEGPSMYYHANGLWSVPWDGYPAILHKNERIIPANQTQQYNSNIYFGNVNLNNGLEIEALTNSIDRRNRRQRSGYGAN